MFEWLFFSVPEAIVILCLALSILGERTTILKLIGIGSVLSLLIYTTRIITGSFILNIFISGLIVVLLIKTVTSTPFSEAAASGLLAISSYLSIEFVNVKIWQMLSGVNPAKIEQDLYLKIAWFSSQIIVILILQFVIGHFTRGKRELKYENKYL
ncbi:hypothetical protein LPY66_07035 [Dehalobacter sp. DCM]|uniref:hypothetical protein n=1 Tax=Dehalobacter sp. DCM TaxID=2907827 RepID=UPI00308134F6|nr:hypothetical protein LPY66_07035 [Dehalobacter sp. DCM]